MALNLCDDYRPKTLNDLYGQEFVVSFFKSVVAHPDEAPRYYYLEGGFGCGKTSLVRAFACSLLGPDYYNSPNYLEIDSSEKKITENFDTIRDLIFQEVPGWKVVCIDEAHMLGEQVVQKLLKILEDFVGKIFIFLASTETHLMFPPLLSRLHQFSLALFTPEQCQDYARIVLKKEIEKVQDTNPELAQKLGSISDHALSIASLNAHGHLRTMLKQVELMYFQGEEYYLESFSNIWKHFEDYFFSDKPTNEVVTSLYGFHPNILKEDFAYFFRDQILNPASAHYGNPYIKPLLPKLFQKYLQLVGLVKNPTDFFSFLYAYRQILEAVKNGR